MQMKTVQETLREMDKKELLRKFFYEHPMLKQKKEQIKLLENI